MSAERTARLNTLWGRLVAEELARCGVDLVCVSPGSRSTPLTAAVARGRIPSRLWLYERGAAFHALGHARATGRPAALVCTSGTAVANYLPAVVEAAQDCVVRRSIPELSTVPDEFIHNPWKMSLEMQRSAGCIIGIDYPTPIVDHAAARLRALAAYHRPG